MRRGEVRFDNMGHMASDMGRCEGMAGAWRVPVHHGFTGPPLTVSEKGMTHG